MPEKVVGYSDKYLKSKCRNCSHERQEIVQTQKYLGIGPVRFVGLGPRDFKISCINCSSLHELSENQVQKAIKLQYSNKPGDSGDVSLTPGSSRQRYPALDPDRREEIRKSNLKEGFASLGIGIIIGIIILVIPNTIAWYAGWSVIAYSILGGLYSAFEDPERKHRDLLNNKKSIF